MANAIELAKSYVPKLDEVYKLASLTAMLDGASDLARQGANANELIIPMMTMDGLADYSRNSGYVQGDVTLTNETVKCNFDRGRRFTVDTMDDLETAGLAFGRLSAEFIRTKVVPELDAFRFAAYCGKTGVTKVEGALADGSAVLQALRAASTALDEAEVPLTERYLFITPSLHGMVQDLDTTKSREVLNNFAKITDVPQTRFYTAIKQLSGASTESAGGYTKGDGAAELYSITNAGIMTIGSSAADTPEETVRKFDSAAGRMFRFIRMGRDVEKIGAPKQPKLKPWLTLLIDSWKK